MHFKLICPPLVQGQPVRRPRLLQQHFLRKKRSFKRQRSQDGRGRIDYFFEGLFCLFGVFLFFFFLLYGNSILIEVFLVLLSNSPVTQIYVSDLCF